MIERVLFEARERQKALELSVFQSPPKDMEDLNRRIGRWMELEETAEWCKKLSKDLEEEDNQL